MNHRLVDYLAVVGLGMLLFLPGLGAHSLWEVDEIHNAECAREMWSAGEWIMPTFNFHLRPDKPVLLYWVMALAYHVLGVTELAARIGSGISGILTLLLTYELGRIMFSRSCGLLAAAVVGSSLMFCVSSRAATPDALLIVCSVATLVWFYRDHVTGGKSWLIGSGLTTGLGFLAKGPVGLVLPLGTIILFLIWQRQLKCLWDWRWLVGIVLFGFVALPWYVMVGVETKMEFIHGFFGRHNLERFQRPFEGHGGGSTWFYFYHPVVVLAGFAPWSAFLGLSIWYGAGRRAKADQAGGCLAKGVARSPTLPARNTAGISCVGARPYLFLWCWISVWFVAFTAAQTKLPNYVLPAYPAIALLTARFLDRWARNEIRPARGWIVLSFVLVGLIGIGIVAGMLLLAGWFDAGLLGGRSAPASTPLAAVGVLLVAAASLGCWLAYRRLAVAATAVLSTGIVAVVAILAGAGPGRLEQYRASRPIAEHILAFRTEADIRIAVHRSYQPGLVYYTQRPVELYVDDERARTLLDGPHQAFVVVSAREWPNLQKQLERPAEVLGSYTDLIKSGEWLLVVNRPEHHEVFAAGLPVADQKVDHQFHLPGKE